MWLEKTRPIEIAIIRLYSMCVWSSRSLVLIEIACKYAGESMTRLHYNAHISGNRSIILFEILWVETYLKFRSFCWSGISLSAGKKNIVKLSVKIFANTTQTPNLLLFQFALTSYKSFQDARGLELSEAARISLCMCMRKYKLCTAKLDENTRKNRETKFSLSLSTFISKSPFSIYIEKISFLHIYMCTHKYVCVHACTRARGVLFIIINRRTKTRINNNYNRKKLLQ